MSMVKLKNIAKIALALSIAAPLFVQAGVKVLDFDYDANGNKINNADAINTQYSAWGVTITGCNLNGNVGAGTDQKFGVCGSNEIANQQIAFDTERSNTIDPDLEFKFENNQYVSESGAVYQPLTERSDFYTSLFDAALASDLIASPGNVLIIEESNGNACGQNCNKDDSSNDEGARPAGFFVFDFDRPVDILSLDFFDVEVREKQLGNPAATLFFHSASGIAEADVPALGNAGYTREAYTNMYNVTRLVVNMPGSGAINNLVFTEASAPAAILLTLLGAGFVFGRRKS